jgi:putative sigma-54 modulation protein
MAMIPVEIFNHDMKATPTLEDYITKKVSNLDKYINSLEAARVIVAFRKALKDAGDRAKVQITLRGKGFVLRAEEQTDQPHSAFDLALEKMERQIERYRGKHYPAKGYQRSNSFEIEEEVIAAYQDDDGLPSIRRRKKFQLFPMDENEAIEQMRLLGHENFFVFYNMDAGCVSVLYKRGDNGFGLIDTELA